MARSQLAQVRGEVTHAEMAYIKAKCRADGTTVTRVIRAAFGLPPTPSAEVDPRQLSILSETLGKLVGAGSGATRDASTERSGAQSVRSPSVGVSPVAPENKYVDLPLAESVSSYTDETDDILKDAGVIP